jgi:hypothetical protein
LANGSRVNREVYARFCERLRVQFPGPTHHRDGWAIWYKRLEVGTFQFPFAATGRKELAAWELAVLLEGIDLSQGKRRKRYTLPAAMKPEEAEKAGGEASAS